MIFIKSLFIEGKFRMKYGLSRILLIDSYLPGQLYQIDVSGHTNVMGENNMGKTSLIKMAVLFYGESPTRVGIKHNEALKHLGFAQYYLPNLGSYIIFEYLVAGEPRMLVMSGFADQKDTYRRTFVKAGFDKSDFWPSDSDSPIRSDVWLREVAQKYTIEQCSSADGQTRTLLEGRNPHFSMVPSRVNLTRMKSLMTSMLSRDAGHTELTKIIEDWARSDLGSEFERNIDSVTISRQDLEKWVRSYHNHHRINQSLERFAYLNQTLCEYDQSLSMSYSLFALAKRMRVELAQQIKEQNTSFENKIQSSKSALLSQRVQLDKLKVDEKRVYAKYQELLNERSGLDGLKKSHESNFPSNLPALESKNAADTLQQSQLEKELSDITSGQGEVNRWYESQVQEAKSLCKDTKLASKNAISQAQSIYHRSVLEHNQELERAYDETVHSIEDQVSELGHKKEGVISLLADINSQMKHPNLDESERSALDNFRDQLKQAEFERTQLNSELDKAKSELASLKADQEVALDSFKAIHRELRLKEEEFDEYQSILNPPAGSLLAFLKREVPHWGEYHGKALSREMLHAGGLSPKLNTEPGALSTVFGVNVDIANLPDTTFDMGDDVSLVETVQELSAQVESLTNECEKQDQVCARVTKKIDEANKSVTFAQSRVSQKNQQVSLILKDVENEIARQDVLLDMKRKALNIEFERITNEKALITIQLDELKEKKKDAEKNKKEEKKSIEAKLSDVREATIAECNNAIALAETQLKTRLVAIDMQYQNQLIEKGVDGNYVANLKAELDAIKTRVGKYNAYCTAKSAYDVFMVNSYSPRILTLIEETESAKTNLEGCKTKTNECETGLIKLSESIKELESSHEAAGRKLHYLCTQLEDRVLIRERFESYGANTAQETLTPEQVCEHFNHHVKKLDTTTQILRALNTELKPLFSVAGSGAFEYFTGSPGNQDDDAQVARKISEYIQGGYRDIDYSAFIQSTQVLERVSLYVHYLNMFRNRVNQYSRELNKYMTKAVAFNQISSLKVDIVFLYSNANDWSVVKDISDQYSLWKSEKNHGRLDSTQIELPHRSLVDAIQFYLDVPNADDMSIGELYRNIDFSIEFTDNDVPRKARTFSEILSAKGGASSNGTSYLILITIFIGILNMMRKGRSIHFTWALDELADISPNNITQLLELLAENDINLISACTVVSEAVYLSFDKTYCFEVDHNTGLKIITDEDNSDPLADLFQSNHDDIKEVSHAE